MRKKGIKAEEYHEFEQFEDPEQIEFVDEDSLDLDSDDYEIINEELIILLLTTGSHSDLF